MRGDLKLEAMGCCYSRQLTRSYVKDTIVVGLESQWLWRAIQSFAAPLVSPLELYPLKSYYLEIETDLALVYLLAYPCD